MSIQTGGMKPSLRVPPFKYVIDKERKLFSLELFPYADLFIDIARQMDWNSYKYTGVNSLYNSESNYLGDRNIITKKGSHLQYFFLGGSIYEILYRKFPNVNLYDYCDATGDVDINVNLPLLDYDGDKIRNDETLLPYFTHENKVNPFYTHVSNWIFDNVFRIFKRYERQLKKMFPDTVRFDLSEYNESDFDRVEAVGDFYVIAFYNKINMYKVQIVCKVVKDHISVIDHAFEIIIALNSGKDFEETHCDPLFNTNRTKYNVINLNGTTYNLQSFTVAVENNLSAYDARKQFFHTSKYIHKSVNHVARLLYLFELFYQNRDFLIDIYKSEKSRFLLQILPSVSSKKDKEWYSTNPYFNYYYYDTAFHRIKIPIFMIVLAYLPIIRVKYDATKSEQELLRNDPDNPKKIYNSFYKNHIDSLNRFKLNFIPPDLTDRQTEDIHTDLLNYIFPKGEHPRTNYLEMFKFDKERRDSNLFSTIRKKYKSPSRSPSRTASRTASHKRKSSYHSHKRKYHSSPTRRKSRSSSKKMFPFLTLG